MFKSGKQAEKPLAPDTRMRGMCEGCGIWLGCIAAETQPCKDGWGDMRRAVVCPNPNCKRIVLLVEDK